MVKSNFDMKNELSLYSPMFIDNDMAVEYFLDKKLFAITINCDKCNASQMKVTKYTQALNGIIYKCQNTKCYSRKTISAGSSFKSVKLECKIILRAIFCFVLNLNNFQALNQLKINEKTYIKIKNILNLKIKNYLDNNSVRLGGCGVSVQCDETAICNGSLIIDPTHTQDDKPNTQWILGLIEESCERRCLLIIIPDRKSETIAKIFSKYMHPQTIIKTDGYPSYPKAALDSGLNHKIVNHNQSFVAEDGTNTNLIEGVWAHFKTLYRSKHGLSKKNLVNFVDEFNWRKNYFNYKKGESIDESFEKIISLLKY
ncbi:hypothetical protein H312_03427 [Anncaliia algerae PRA339]|uniref:ISXO2-like transposase domain-containing protein n=1 Tax=Anncaliia algerae PRA339 TaxID=1288291 RepID=A0A059EWE1_9MICR|nr:hypothetical protein H312_03427 [Anncaliia algerae PRA339]